MTEVEYLHRLTESAVSEEAARLERVGKVCPSFCFACGRATGDLGRCDCDYPSALRCAGGKMLCSECRSAHRAVASHLAKMFAAPPARRVDAVRARLARFLRSALIELYGRYKDSHAVGLRRRLSELDPYLDSKSDFRRDVLDIFTRSKFSRWPELAAELRREENDYYIEAVVTSGILGR